MPPASSDTGVPSMKPMKNSSFTMGGMGPGSFIASCRRISRPCRTNTSLCAFKKSCMGGSSFPHLQPSALVCRLRCQIPLTIHLVLPVPQAPPVARARPSSHTPSTIDLHPAPVAPLTPVASPSPLSQKCAQPLVLGLQLLVPLADKLTPLASPPPPTSPPLGSDISAGSADSTGFASSVSSMCASPLGLAGSADSAGSASSAWVIAPWACYMCR